MQEPADSMALHGHVGPHTGFESGCLHHLYIVSYHSPFLMLSFWCLHVLYVLAKKAY